jgi:negative regulator of sigma E activity
MAMSASNRRADPLIGENTAMGEQMSSLLDGELDGARCDTIFRRLREEPRTCRDWALLNVACDALRSSDVAAWHSDGFESRLRAALDAEPTVLAPPPRRRWQRWVGSGAAVAAAGALVFAGVSQLRSVPATGPNVVSAAATTAPAAATTTTSAAVPIERLPEMERYLAAHRELARPMLMPDATRYLRTSATVPAETERR